MSLISVYFFVLLTLTLVAFYILPGRFQKYALLVGSVVFFCAVSGEMTIRFLGIIVYIIVITFIAGLVMSRIKGPGRCAVVSVSIVLLVAMLFIHKYMFNVFTLLFSVSHADVDVSFMQIAAPIGISYYTLSAIGYIMEVYWENIDAEKNLLDIALFVIYFPQIISGPVTKYPDMKERFDHGHEWKYENIASGVLRMAWGYFQKLVISERFGTAVDTLFDNYREQSGLILVCAVLCYAVQLYTDFSGCMDIIMGSSMLFGIELPENFRAPFFSRSIQEFWQRWHITLGQWFKDYVMYPLQLTAPLIKIGKIVGKRFGKKAGRKASFYLSMMVLWVLIGIWHGGTAYYFIASAAIPFALLFISDLLSKDARDKKEVTGVRRALQSIRTVLLVCMSWIFVCAGSVGEAIGVYKQIFTRFVMNTSSDYMTLFGFTATDIVMMVLGCLLLFVVDSYKDKGVLLQQAIVEKGGVIYFIVAAALIVLTISFGRVGNSSFIYFQF